MKILSVSQHFPPEIGAPSAPVRELSRRWVELGHEVTVLTGFLNHPNGVRDDGFNSGDGILEESRVDGIRVIRTWLYFTPNRGVYPRGMNSGSFMISNELSEPNEGLIHGAGTKE